ncbi:hypothetical protein PI124_g21871 [Phytophthora idaei]|nr:hypothetical protein PI125_g23703 [Phytophthora idaei]KAG3127710.1 hypothetical protein PI126_g21727 [Phytophthora idaei]KAG3233051.1 hypothetical protein PI124_g21871 [Phytophthora idaei]
MYSRVSDVDLITARTCLVDYDALLISGLSSAECSRQEQYRRKKYMSGGSVLTQGLEPLGSKSKVIRTKLSELYVRDDELQAAHQQAKRDDDFGEEVVTKYKSFLSCRDQLITELEKQKIQVPWQLRMTIDDLELTLKQRREKKEGNASSGTKKESDAKPPKQNQVPAETAPTVQSGRVTVAFLGPTLIALVIAMFWYHYNA